MIIFNLPAVGQAIVYFILLFILDALNIGNDIGPDGSQVMTFFLMAFVAAYTDVLGIKGRLFYIPSWILCIAVTIFVLENMVYYENYPKIASYTYPALIFIVVTYYLLYLKRIKKKWLKSSAALQLLKQESKLAPVPQHRFWLLASNIFFYPTYWFMNANGFWSTFHRNAIVSDEFLKHYMEFINMIDLEKIYNDQHKSWILELKRALNSTKHFKHYRHPDNAFQNLAKVIDYKNNHLNSDED